MSSTLKLPLLKHISSFRSRRKAIQNEAKVQSGSKSEPEVKVHIEEKPEDEPVSVIKAADAGAVPSLMKELNALSDNFSSNADEGTRLEMLIKARTLWMALETPRETMIRHCWAQPSVLCALTAGSEKDVWTYLADHSDPFKASEVGKATGIDPPLLSRFMRHLAAMGYLKEISADTYERTNFTKAMALPYIGQSYLGLSGACLAAIERFHIYANTIDWKTPTDMSNGSYQHAYNTKMNFFEYIQTNQPYGEQFNYHMAGYNQGRPSWMDPGFFLVDRLVNGFDNSEGSTMLVDIGGSTGHDLEEFCKKHPDVPGRLIIQDLPIVVGQISNLDKRIESMAYDFNTEQPIKGARAYYMHSILHDWPDDACLTILSNITAAMKPGYSKLLINENVIPDTNANWEATGLDIIMLTLLSALERTHENWQNLLSQAGLKIVKVWSAQHVNGQSLIECELA